jgi:hypothetical protein
MATSPPQFGFDAIAEGGLKDYYAEEIIKTRSQHKVAADDFHDLLSNHLNEDNRKIAERALLHVQSAQRAKADRAKEAPGGAGEELMKEWKDKQAGSLRADCKCTQRSESRSESQSPFFGATTTSPISALQDDYRFSPREGEEKALFLATATAKNREGEKDKVDTAAAKRQAAEDNRPSYNVFPQQGCYSSTLR